MSSGLNNVLKFKEKNSKITNNIKKADKKFKFLINSLSVKLSNCFFVKKNLFLKGIRLNVLKKIFENKKNYNWKKMKKYTLIKLF